MHSPFILIWSYQVQKIKVQVIQGSNTLEGLILLFRDPHPLPSSNFKGDKQSNGIKTKY